jgi:biofilm protein TabA
LIVCNIENTDFLGGLSETLDTAFDWIRKGAWENLPIGRHPIDGDRVFLLVSEYETKDPDSCLFETHRRNIDIQMLVSGREYIMVRSAAGMKVHTPYSPDIEFLDGNDRVGNQAPGGSIRDAHTIVLAPGIAVVLFPEDAHKPCVRVSESPETVRKIVVKVAL